MQLWVVRAARRLSNGERPNGEWRGVQWQDGYAGPYSEAKARDVARLVGGNAHQLGAVSDRLLRKGIERIEQEEYGQELAPRALPDLLEEEDEETADEEPSDEETADEETADEETADEEPSDEDAEDAEDGEFGVYPTAEEAGYHKMMSLMSGADFPYDEFIEDRGMDEITRVYQDEFLKSRDL